MHAQTGVYIPKKQPLTPAQQKALVAACQDGLDRLLVFPLLDAGLRMTEWCSLRMANVIGPTLLVAGRALPLSKRVALALKRRFRKYRDMPFQPRAAEGRLQAIAERAGLPRITPDVLRRTFAANAVAAGVTPRGLQDALGGSLASATKLYISFDPKR